MKFYEQVENIVKEIEKLEYPDNENAFCELYNKSLDAKDALKPVIDVISATQDIEKQIQFISVFNYKNPRRKYTVVDAKEIQSREEYRIQTFKREKKKLLMLFQKLKLEIEKLQINK